MPARHTRLSPSAVQTALGESLAELRRSLELPEAFPPAVLAEAEAVVASGTAVDGSDDERADLRALPFLTIDPEGSRDLDQAMHIAREGGGFVAHYAIADLAAFVRPGGAIDAEAQRRGQTLYAPDGSVPLHPEVLSHGAASLLPDEDRRAYVWRFPLDAAGTPDRDGVQLVRAWVRSRGQWTYEGAQAAIDAGTGPDTLALLAELGPLRVAQEARRGGASLNAPEEEIVDGPDGYAIQRRALLPVEDWNAQISLMTGMAAADIMLSAGRGILRTLPPADDDARAEFRRQVALLGRPWPEDLDYGEYLRRLDPSDDATPAILQAASALFRGADYIAFLSPDEIPADVEQAAIGAPYAHATAPLRRLVDRYTLRACHGDVDEEVLPRLPESMRRSSALASRLESGAVDRVEAAVLHRHIGHVLDAVVLSQTKGGSRVQLADPFVTATVPEAVEPGTRIRVRVEATDIATGSVTLSAV
ncbi:RNB domain-containing ribonuclease [Microbacterium oryzae]|uniref:RNB domain-containing ribonuclease n=1 Tax=Microbacterium oryzae TaxID=743009 RepID=UPI0025AFCE1A|nr:RNB domain-containing ribonuclease [Microbacterium oryzae]MDN3311458.1 RNB domain-containing ribonuclease [Microbacterium oryzae]